MGSAAPWSRRTTRVAPRSCRPEFSYVRSLPACRSLALDRHSHSSAQLLSRTRGPKRSLDEPASDHDITGAAGVDVPRFGAAGSRRDARGLRCSAFFAYLYAGGSWGARCMYGPRAPHPMTAHVCCGLLIRMSVSGRSSNQPQWGAQSELPDAGQGERAFTAARERADVNSV